MKTAIPAVILAGGQSRRMGGGDKPLLELAGVRIIDRIIGILTPQCAPLAINANGDAARFGLSLPIVSDADASRSGPLAGILAALEWSATLTPACDVVLTVSGDCPFLPINLVARLMARMTQTADLVACVASSGGRLHPTIALWRSANRELLRTHLAATQDRSVRAWLESRSYAAVEWPSIPADPFFNINTKDDLAAAAAMFGDRGEAAPQGVSTARPTS